MPWDCQKADWKPNIQFKLLFRYRPFIVMPIPSSNLILLVRDMNCPIDDPYYKITLIPKVFANNSTCSLPERQPMYRRRPASCINHHQNVSESHRQIQSNFLNLSHSRVFHTGIEHRSMWTRESNINQCDASSNNIHTRSHSLANSQHWFALNRRI